MDLQSGLTAKNRLSKFFSEMMGIVHLSLYPQRSHWHHESLRLGELLLAPVKSQEVRGLQL